MARDTSIKLLYRLPTVFDDPDGDVILRSADFVDFRVYRLILSKGSPVFADMFCSPTPVVASIMEVRDRAQIVTMEESAFVISALLQLCYPMEDPVIETLVELRSVLEAMVKYQMDGIRRGWIKKMLTLVAEREPWGVYATTLALGRISCHYRMEDETRLAARFIIRILTEGPLVEEMDMISGADYHRLLQYRRKCCEKVLDTLTLPKVFKRVGSNWVWMKPCTTCHQKVVSIFADGIYYNISAWWTRYLNRAKYALRKQPWGHVVEDEALWVDLVEKLVNDCPCCAKVAFSQVPLYTKKFAEALEYEISEIKLEIEW